MPADAQFRFLELYRAADRMADTLTFLCLNDPLAKEAVEKYQEARDALEKALTVSTTKRPD